MNNTPARRNNNQQAGIIDMLDRPQVQAEFAKVLGAEMTSEHFARIALTTLRKNPKLVQKCDAISILTAVLLKAMLDVIGGVEHRVKAYFDEREGTLWGVLGTASLFGILFISKFIILEVVNIVFGDHVELGHLIDIVLLIVAMIAMRLIFRQIYQRLGDEPLP